MDLTSFSSCLLKAAIQCKSPVATVNTTCAIGLRRDGTWCMWIGIWRAVPIYGQSIWIRKRRVRSQTASSWKSKQHFHPTATGSHLLQTRLDRVRSTCKLFRVQGRNARFQAAEAKSQPVHSGKELFYRLGGQVFVVPMEEKNGGMNSGRPKRLFEGLFNYTITFSGATILARRTIADGGRTRGTGRAETD